MISVIISRFKAWLRSLLDEKPTFGMSQPTTIPDAAASLVERSRQGDQNAVAMICEIRDAAARGEPRAIQTADALKNYIKKHPTNDAQVGAEFETDAMANDILASFGSEEYPQILVEKVLPLAEQDIKKAIVTVSQGPILFPTNEGESLVRRVGECLPEGDVREAFKLGAKDAAAALQAMANIQSLGHDAQHALILGYVLGKARQLQLVRIPEMPVKVQSELASLELD